MCRASTEPGGPKRCGSHAKKLYLTAVEQFENAKKELLLVSRIDEALDKGEYRSVFWRRKKHLKEMKPIFDELFEVEDQANKAFEEYDRIITHHHFVAFRERENIEYTRDGLSEELYNEQGELKALRNAFYGTPTGQELSVVKDQYQSLKVTLDDRKREWWGTEEGLLEEVNKPEAWEGVEGRTPSTHLNNVVMAFSRASNSREHQRRRVMEDKRLHAKNMARAKEWEEYQVWQDAWDADPTLIDDTYSVHSKLENGIALRANRRGYILYLTAKPNGRFKREVDFRRNY